MKPWFLFALFSLLTCIKLKAQFQLHSPDGSIKLVVNQEPDGSLTYEVNSLKTGVEVQLLKKSKLGLTRNDCDFYDGLSISSIDSTQKNESYSLKTGKKKENSFESKTMTIRTSKCGVDFDIIFKTLNNGVAYRYFFPDESATQYSVSGEYSEFALSNTNGTAWMQENSNSYPVYEGFFNEVTPGSSSSQASGFVFPALISVNNQWLLLTETDLDSNYFASHLGQFPSGGTYQLKGPYPYDEVNQFDQLARFSTPMKTPWRVVVIGKELSEIVESNLTNDLASPSTIEDQSFIETGIATFSWWSSFTSSGYIDSMKHYVDLAASLHCPFFTIDADWDKISNLETELPLFVDYANNKGVKLWTWYNMGGPHNANSYANTTTPRDSMHIRETRRQHLQWIKNMGIVGIKVDFMMSDKQELIKYYLDILKDAAEFDLMVNFHGATAPRGWQRTYPNLMTMEAVAGAEGILFNPNFRQRVGSHNVTLLFTRNVLGSMDYTPGVLGHTYRNNGDNIDHNSTVSHQLALFSLFESGISHSADHYTRYSNLPEIAKEIIRHTPGSWDETRLLSGYPDQDVILARKDKLNWFVSGINGENFSKTKVVQPDFLPPGKYRLSILKDGPTKSEIVTSSQIYSDGSQISIDMLPYGGFTLFFEAYCLDDLSLQETLTKGNIAEYQAGNIQSVQLIEPNTSFILKGEKSINLLPEFQTESGAIFKATIEDCPD